MEATAKQYQQSGNMQATEIEPSALCQPLGNHEGMSWRCKTLAVQASVTDTSSDSYHNWPKRYDAIRMAPGPSQPGVGRHVLAGVRSAEATRGENTKTPTYSLLCLARQTVAA